MSHGRSAPRVIFNTATTLDGFLADDDHSLSWLFAVPGADGAESGFAAFLEGVGVLVMGSSTYEWLLRHEGLLENPEKWFYPGIASFVFTSRELPPVDGADIRFRGGEIGELWAELTDAAGDHDIWLVGGGDLVGQFDDAGRLDEIRVSIAPVTLGSGKPLLPRRIESDRLTLRSATMNGPFAELVFDVNRRAIS